MWCTLAVSRQAEFRRVSTRSREQEEHRAASCAYGVTILHESHWYQNIRNEQYGEGVVSEDRAPTRFVIRSIKLMSVSVDDRRVYLFRIKDLNECGALFLCLSILTLVRLYQQ